MSEVIKEKYEISVWRDIYELREGQTEPTWYEDKIAIIGSDTRNDAARAFNPKLTLDVYGQESFDFDIYSRYYNEEGALEENPYLSLLSNEVKIKLYYRGEWHDFIIKNAEESHSNNLVIKYSCQSLAIYELGKSGYDLSFTEENETNIFSATEFINRTLEGTDWTFDRGTANLLEETLEPACQAPIASGSITGSIIDYELVNGKYVEKLTPNQTFSAGGVFLFPYSETQKNTGLARGTYVADGKNIEFDTWTYKVTNGVRCEVEAKWAYNAGVTKYKVGKVVGNATQVYNKYLKRYVYVYENANGDKYYGYDTYTNAPYAFVYRVTENSVGVVLMNVPAKAAVFDFLLDGRVVGTPKDHTSAYEFEVSDNAQHTFSIQPFDSNNKPLDEKGNVVESGGVKYSVRGSAGGTNWTIYVNDLSELEALEKYNFTTVYFKENDETNVTTSLPDGYEQVNTYEKYRTMEVENSNRFNITQSIAEIFEVWCRYVVEHDKTGHIISKKVTLADEFGQDNVVGFRYGINLTKVNRTVTSEELVTKLYVEELENSAATDGWCSITTAVLNPSRENFLLDFTYFIDNGMISEETLQKEIFGSTGYYSVLRNLNNQYETLINTKFGYGDNSLVNRKLTLISEIQLEKSKLYAAQETLNEMNAKGETDGQSKYLNIVSTAQANIELKEKELASVNNSLEKYEKDLQDILRKKKLANENFYKKFSRFIQEGTWTGENYIDANVYFFDAQKVIARGSQPKVNYSLDVIDVSSLVDNETGWSYSPYAFKVGDISSIIDTQYFGYIDKAKTKPKKEKVVVSEVTYMLDNPEKNSLQIQNYSTQFQDLFQRLNASVQSLELNKNTYAKSENFTGKGALTLESLQESFDKNKQLAFSNVDSKIIYDNTGITLSTNGIDDKTGETIENKYQVKLVGGGIILSSDGGQTWKTGIYGGEINTALLRAGQIDAELINIMMGTVPTFKWDKDGLVAYGQTIDKEGKTVVVKTGQRVVFDGEGIRGYYEKGENDTYNIPNFSLTHNGLTIDNPYDHTMDRVPVISVNGKANPDSEGHLHKFIVYNDGSLEAYNGTFNGTVRAAKFEGMSQGKLIGPELMVGLKEGKIEGSVDGNDYNFWVDSNGKVKLSGEISWFDSDLGNYSADLSTNNLVFKLNLLGVYTPSSSSVSFSAARGTNDLSFVSSNPDVEEYTITYSSTGCSCSRLGESLIISPNSSNGMVTVTFIFNNGKTITKYISVSVVEDGEQGEQGPRGQDFSGYDWIKSTEITVDGIKTPTLDANVVAVGGHFSVGTIKNNTMKATGYMGYAEGSGTTYDEDGNVIMTLTEGVGISATTTRITDSTTSPYIIVTTEGARMSAGGASLLVCNGKAMVKQSGGKWQEIGSGKAVFG